MIFLMILSVIAGILTAQFGLLPDFFVMHSDRITDYALYLLLFLIGYGIGRDKESLIKLFTADRYAFLVPIGTIIGTLFGGYVASFFLNLTIRDSLAISAGFGWYSLSAVIIAKLKSADLGSIAFLSNVARELISIILVPFLARYAGPYVSIAPGGATTMDTTLPIIEKYAGESAAVVAFINGFILSALVPVLVPFILKF
ncbi:lysine exporter LysO family protein [Deferribacter autotrophicus]|uniref:Lysine exporter LysO family protein n=1 Tax=Deferribacter autotrophicus TaxID=500465 RepID=A0A5A8F7F1_9BACT|nr:lysine exporter LysO family protein [Deferribacter autotrophicus]KAA0259329.1 lysine exporter LysO family protein [Deferribacter autotrophicus]